MNESTAGIADLKAHLSQYLARVRRGERIVVCDRKTPIAVIEPWAEDDDVVIRPGKGRISDVLRDDLVPLIGNPDVLAMLFEDREDD